MIPMGFSRPTFQLEVVGMPSGNVVILAEGEGFYIIINNGWEMKVRIKDLNTGESRIIVANESNPAIEAEGNNIAVRLLGIKGEGVSFSYSA